MSEEATPPIPSLPEPQPEPLEEMKLTPVQKMHARNLANKEARRRMGVAGYRTPVGIKLSVRAGTALHCRKMTPHRLVPVPMGIPLRALAWIKYGQEHPEDLIPAKYLSEANHKRWGKSKDEKQEWPIGIFVAAALRILVSRSQARCKRENHPIDLDRVRAIEKELLDHWQFIRDQQEHKRLQEARRNATLMVETPKGHQKKVKVKLTKDQLANLDQGGTFKPPPPPPEEPADKVSPPMPTVGSGVPKPKSVAAFAVHNPLGT